MNIWFYQVAAGHILMFHLFFVCAHAGVLQLVSDALGAVETFIFYTMALNCNAGKCLPCIWGQREGKGPLLWPDDGIRISTFRWCFQVNWAILVSRVSGTKMCIAFNLVLLCRVSTFLRSMLTHYRKQLSFVFSLWCRWFCVEAGSSSSPKVLLIHGLPSQVGFYLLIAYFLHD